MKKITMLCIETIGVAVTEMFVILAFLKSFGVPNDLFGIFLCLYLLQDVF